MKFKKSAMELEQVVSLLIVLIVIIAVIVFITKFSVIKQVIVNMFT